LWIGWDVGRSLVAVAERSEKFLGVNSDSGRFSRILQGLFHANWDVGAGWDIGRSLFASTEMSENFRAPNGSTDGFFFAPAGSTEDLSKAPTASS